MSVHHHLNALILMFLCSHIFVVCSSVIYITASADEPNCSAKPCVTLPQLNTNLTNYSSNNVSIIFLQGKHHLDRKLQFVNISSLSITYSHSNSTAENASIACSENASFEFNHVDKVSISNLNFTGCENKMQSVNILIIEQSSFHGKHYSGSAVELVESTAFILKSNFISNLNGNYLGPIEILRLKVHSSTVFAKAGGALVATQSEVNIIDSVFEKNSAVVGGAIFSWRNSNVTIVNSTFYRNSASSHDVHVESYGGAVYFESDDYNNIVPYNTSYNITTVIHSTSFTENKAYYGGALAIVAGYISVKSSYFGQNIAVYGGSLMSLITMIMTDNSEFESNIAAEGGAAVAYDNTVFSITNSVFTLNTAQNIGGAIVVEKALCKIFNSDFSNNTAESGGALIVHYSKLLNVNISRFNHNNVFGSSSAGGVIQTIHSKVMIYHSQFYNNGAEDEGGVVNSLTDSQVGIEDCQFVNNYAQSAAGVLLLQNYSSAVILGSTFENNRGGLVGGVVVLVMRSNLTIGRSHLYSNQALSGGGVLQAQDWSITEIFNSVFRNSVSGVIRSCCFSTTVIESSIFINNEAHLEAIIAGFNFTTFNIHGSRFENNIGHKNENVSIGLIACIMTFMYSQAYISDSNFSRNSAQDSVGLIRAYTMSNLTLTNVQASNNTAYMGGVLALEAKSTASIYKSSFVGNNARYLGGAIYIFDCQSVFIYDSIFSENHGKKGVIFLDLSHTVLMADIIVSHNYGSLFSYSSSVQFTGKISITDNTSPQNGNSEAGAITAFQSVIMVEEGKFCITQNNAENGGGIHATGSIIFIRFNATATINNNMARNNGGGLYLYHSELICKYNCTLRITNNTASKKGGGIYAVSSSTKVYFGRNWRYNYTRAMIYINNNVAEKGGGVCLEGNTNLYIFKFDDSDKKNTFLGYGFHFMANTADYGGAVYIADETNVETCDSNYHYANNANSSECSIQVISLDMSLINIFDMNSISFQQNFAYKSGSAFFGGLLDRCIPSHFAEIYKILNFRLPNHGIIDGTTYLQYISNIKPDSISSQPVRLCFCHNGQQNCSYQHPGIKVKKGEAFTITLVAVDQVNHSVPNTGIHSYLLFSESSLGEGQLQMTNEYCTNLTFSITSILAREQVTMHPEGPCKDALMSRSTIDIQFLKCTCPIGFQENADYNETCVCECDTKIFPEYISACDSKAETVVRKPKCWISFVNINDTKNSSGYLTYSYCPFDYCLPSSTELNLNAPDAQCAHNRRGLLCGTCKNGLSLSLGSSHCLLCTNWSSNFAIILTSTFLVGIAIVAIILVIKLTVASGTLSGIIFYANIINASSSTFLPFASPNVITVAIAWLNLEFGIDMCFFTGMDAYWKAWIELIFPAYLIFLVVLVIYMCKYFNKFARLIAGKNPVDIAILHQDSTYDHHITFICHSLLP